MRKFFFAFILIALISGCATSEKKADINGTVFYPSLPQTPRIQYLTHISDETDIGKKRSAFEEFIVGELPPLKKIGRPYGIETFKDKIYVMDRSYKKLLIIDLKNKSFDYLKTKTGALIDPAGIWVSEDDYKYVADFKRKEILVYDENNAFVNFYGKGVLEKPIDVAVYGEYVYVCDINLDKIIVFDKDSGDVVRKIGKRGSEEGEFFKPSHITVDKDGNLYVMDSFNYRVQQFDAFGDFVNSIGYHGDTIGGFARPKGIAIDDQQHLYVVDTAFENVQIFDATTGDTLLFFGGFGSEPGYMYMPSPIHVTKNNLDYFQKYADKNFHLEYLIYVGNSFGPAKINIYGFGSWTGKAVPSSE